jgi:hypothetical protein
MAMCAIAGVYPALVIASPKPRAIVSLANRHFPPIQRSCNFATTTAHRANV